MSLETIISTVKTLGLSACSIILIQISDNLVPDKWTLTLIKYSEYSVYLKPIISVIIQIIIGILTSIYFIRKIRKT